MRFSKEENMKMLSDYMRIAKDFDIMSPGAHKSILDRSQYDQESSCINITLSKEETVLGVEVIFIYKMNKDRNYYYAGFKFM